VTLDFILRRIDEEQARVARDAMEKPAGRDPYEYGRMVGMYAGVGLVRQLLVGMVAEDEQKGRDL